MGSYHGKMKKILIFGNGKLHKTFLQEIHEGDYVIGVDRAAYWLLRNGVTPDAAIGDFDSTTKKEMSSIRKSIRIVKEYPSEKNWTDMELAMKYADTLETSEVYIFGATGTRLDHTLATLHLLDTHIVIDKTNRIRVVGRGKTVIEKASYRYISILPYTKIISFSLSGFRYDVPKTKLVRNSSRGISNEILGKEATIDITAGKAWVIESND